MERIKYHVIIVIFTQKKRISLRVPRGVGSHYDLGNTSVGKLVLTSMLPTLVPLEDIPYIRSSLGLSLYPVCSSVSYTIIW